MVIRATNFSLSTSLVGFLTNFVSSLMKPALSSLMTFEALLTLVTGLSSNVLRTSAQSLVQVIYVARIRS